MHELSDELADALFASDLAQDVRTEFNDRREIGLSIADAMAEVVAAFRHHLDRPDDGPVVIVVLAALQMIEGALSSTFRDAAIELIRDGHGFQTQRSEVIDKHLDRKRLLHDLSAALATAQVVEDAG